MGNVVMTAIPSDFRTVSAAELPDPVMQVTFDAANAKDVTGRGNDGTVVGNPEFVQGVSGKAIHLRNSQDVAGLSKQAEQYVNFGTSADLKFGAEDFSLAFWFKTDPHDREGSVISNKNWDSGSNPGFNIGDMNQGLKKLIDKSVQFDSNKDLYTEESFQVFKKAYDEAVQVYQNEKATQEEVDQARVNLESGRWQLREKPDKDKLEELLAKIAKIDFSLYSKKTAKAVKAAYEMASVLMADETVTQLEIDKAVEQLESAMQILDEESLSGEIISDQEETLSGKVIASNKGDDGNKKETKPTKTAKTVKTGDMANPFALIMLAVMAGAVITAVSVKTKKQR